MKSSKQKRRSRIAGCMCGVGAAIVVAALQAAPAIAPPGSGEATIVPAQHERGRTLSGQDVRLLAGEAAGGQVGKLTLPIDELNPGSQPSARSAGSLRFKHGRKSVALSGVRFDFSSGALLGSLGGSEIPVFRLGAAADVNGATGSISLVEGKLRLTAEAAGVLERKLGLERALMRRGVGMLWIAAQASPTHAAPQPVVSGGLEWGVLASWRKYILGNFGPGSVGTIVTADGATSTGTLSAAGAFFSFPAAAGSFEKGLYGAADRLSLNTVGSVTFAKPGHCIVEVEFSGLELRLDGASARIALDSVSDIDAPAGMTCTDVPALSSADAPFAALDLGGVSPVYSADGKTIAWSAIPSTLTEAGSTAWGAGYAAGQALDPVTIAVGLG